MKKRVMGSTERSKREILPLPLALYHAVQDYPGGAAAIAATTGRNATTLAHKLSPTQPTHVVNIDELAEILELTGDERILDSIHSLMPQTGWVYLGDLQSTCAPETLAIGVAELFQKASSLAAAAAAHIKDGVIDEHELAEAEKLAAEAMRALFGLINRARYVHQTTKDGEGYGRG